MAQLLAGSTVGGKQIETTTGAAQKVATHAENEVMHLTPEERTKYLSKTPFSGKYSDLAEVPGSFPPSAHTHSYNNLENLPTIPGKTSQLTNDSSYVQSNAAKITVAAAGNPPANPGVNDIWIVI